MRIVKTTAIKKTTTRRAVKKAIKSQDSENLLSYEELQNEIRMKAYELFLQRGGQWGNPEQDWIEAEKIVLKKIS